MSGISTHILDLTTGRPARGVRVTLFRDTPERLIPLPEQTTDTDGRVRDLLGGEAITPGIYRVRFGSGAYFAGRNVAALHPYVEVAFEIRDATEHFHVPLLLTPYSYTTYRGS